MSVLKSEFFEIILRTNSYNNDVFNCDTTDSEQNFTISLLFINKERSVTMQKFVEFSFG